MPINYKETVPVFPVEKESTRNKLIRLLISRDIDPELTELMGRIPALKREVQRGRLRFHGEIPGYNSNRLYFGFKWRF